MFFNVFEKVTKIGPEVGVAGYDGRVKSQY